MPDYWAEALAPRLPAGAARPGLCHGPGDARGHRRRQGRLPLPGASDPLPPAARRGVRTNPGRPAIQVEVVIHVNVNLHDAEFITGINRIGDLPVRVSRKSRKSWPSLNCCATNRTSI